MRVCVIGGGGFIGVNVVSALVQTGRDVIVLGRKKLRPRRLSKKAVYHAGDYSNLATLRECIADCGEVIDLAYATVPKTSFSDPVGDIEANLPPFVRLLDEVRDQGCRLLVTSSGGAVYGPSHDFPLIEDAVTRPISPYGITKLTIERYASMYHMLHGVPVIIARPGNAYGIGQQPFSGQGFIATAMGCILKRCDVEVFGNSGTIRDYVHVRDIAEALVSLLDFGSVGEVYNIGSGMGRSNLEILQAISPFARQEKMQVNLKISPARKFDVLKNILSFDKIHKCSNWRPRVEFEFGLKEMWQDLLENGFG